MNTRCSCRQEAACARWLPGWSSDRLVSGLTGSPQALLCPHSPCLPRPAPSPEWTLRKHFVFTFAQSLELAAPSPWVYCHLGQLSHCLLGPLKLDYRRRENISHRRAVGPAWDISTIFFLSFWNSHIFYHLHIGLHMCSEIFSRILSVEWNEPHIQLYSSPHKTSFVNMIMLIKDLFQSSHPFIHYMPKRSKISKHKLNHKCYNILFPFKKNLYIPSLPPILYL